MPPGDQGFIEINNYPDDGDEDKQVKQSRRGGAMAMKNASNLRIKDVMTPSPACCVPGTPLQEVAMLLVEHDCGAIPVVDDRDRGRPVGVVTDRDIACRTVAAGRDALQLTAGDCMSAPCVTAALDMTLEDCCRLMEGNRVRRIVVVDESGGCCGIVSQADVALRAPEKKTAEVVRVVSQPTTTPA